MKSNVDDVSLQGVTIKPLVLSQYDVGVTLGTGN